MGQSDLHYIVLFVFDRAIWENILISGSRAKINEMNEMNENESMKMYVVSCLYHFYHSFTPMLVQTGKQTNKHKLLLYGQRQIL